MKRIKKIKKALAALGVFVLFAGLVSACGREAPGETPTDIVTESSSNAGNRNDQGESSPTAGAVKDEGETSPDKGAVKDEGETSPDTGGVSLQNFCADAELDAWFDSLEENIPVRMQYWIYGIGPYGMEFTDQDLILAAAKALQTVRIGDLSDFDPDAVCDAGGTGYYFEMADGSRMDFSFVMNTFRWKKGAYHQVESYGDLGELSRILQQIGNPQEIAACAADDGFYTRYLESYREDWEDEEKLFGGLRVETGDEENVPFISIARCFTQETDPGVWLQADADEELEKEIKERGWTITGSDPMSEYSFAKITLSGKCFAAEDENGEKMTLLILALLAKDSLLKQDHLVRFCAVYHESEDPDITPAAGVINNSRASEKQKTLQALETALKHFKLIHMPYEKKAVQPGSALLDFINDDIVRAWFEEAKKNIPMELLYVEDTWYSITDPEAVLTVMEALETVVIGGVSDAHVGGAGRQIFDFNDDNGSVMELMFFRDTFDWEGESYDVLDWGELAVLDLKKMAE